MLVSRLLVVAAALALASHAAAQNQDIPAGTSAGLAPGSPEVTLEGTLLLNTSDGSNAAVTSVTVNASTAAIDVQGTGTITLGGPLEFSWAYLCKITGSAACRLNLPNIWMTNLQNASLEADGPGVDIGSLSGVNNLGGSAVGCTVHTLSGLNGNLLQKYGTGTWIVTGDNSAQTWGVDIGAGQITLAPGASFGTSSTNIGNSAVLALPSSPAGQSSPSVSFQNGGGGTLDLADGVVGQTNVSWMQGPINCTFILRLDISADGVDHLVVGGTAGTSGGYVVFNQVGTTLTQGTYTFMTNTQANPNLLEQHFGFGYLFLTTNPTSYEYHYNIVYTQRFGNYDLTMRPVYTGFWPAMTVQVTPSSGDTSKYLPLALPLPGDGGGGIYSGTPVYTAKNTAVGITLVGIDYNTAVYNDAVFNPPTIISWAYAQPAHGSVTGSGANVTYTPATDFSGTDSFTFTVTDNYGSTSAPATIYIGVGVNPIVLPPMAFPQLGVTTAANTAKPITLAGMAYNGGTIASYAYTQPAHGTVNGSGANVTYTPASDYNGSDSFTFWVATADGATSAPALVTLSVGSGGGGGTAPAITNIWINKLSLKLGTDGKESWQAQYLYNADRTAAALFNPQTDTLGIALDGVPALSIIPPGQKLKGTKPTFSFKSLSGTKPARSVVLDESAQTLTVKGGSESISASVPATLHNQITLGTAAFAVDAWLDGKGKFTPPSGYRTPAFVVSAAKLSAKSSGHDSASFTMRLADSALHVMGAQSAMRFRVVIGTTELINESFNATVVASPGGGFKLKSSKDTASPLTSFSYDSKSGKCAFGLKSADLTALTAAAAHLTVELTIGTQIYATGVTVFAPKPGAYSTAMPR